MAKEQNTVANRILNLQYSLFQIVPWGSFGVILGYAGSFCLNRGMSDAQYGILLACVCAGAFGLQLIIAELISRIPRLNPQNCMLLIGVLMTVFCAAMSLLPLPNVCMIGSLAVVCVLFQLLPSLANSLAVSAMHQGIPINFGLSRGIGSAAYAILSYLTGLLIAGTGTLAVPRVELALSVLLVVAALTFPRLEKVEEETSSDSGTSLFRDTRFLLLFLGVTLLYACHCAMANFLYQIIVSRGGTEVEQGISNALAAFCELPVMFCFSWFLKKGRCDTWLKIAGGFVAGKALLMLLSTNCGVIYAAQLTHLLGYSMFIISSVYYVGSVVPKKDVVRSQTMLASGSSLGNLMFSLCGGLALEYTGVQGLLSCSLGLGVIGVIILLFSLKKVERPIGN